MKLTAAFFLVVTTAAAIGLAQNDVRTTSATVAVSRGKSNNADGNSTASLHRKDIRTTETLADCVP